MRNLSLAIVFIWMISSCSSQEEKKSESQSQSKIDTVEAEVTYKKTILFFGNSLTAGYGLDLDQAFPAIIQKRLDSLGYSYQVVNAGLSGETTASGKNRIEWVLRTIPDIFILELGANDGLRGLPLSETSKNLKFIVDKVREANNEVDILLAGMMVPPNLGQDYTKEFSDIFPRLAKENDLILIPFLLDGVAGESELNLPDGIHPTPEGHKIVAENIWEILEPVLSKK